MGLVRDQYEKLSPRLISAMTWIDSPERTEEELKKWYPRYKIMFDIVTQLERTIRCGNE